MAILKKEICKRKRLVRARKIGKHSVEKLMKLYAALQRRLVCELCVPFDVHKVDSGSSHRGVAATVDGWEELRIPEDLRVHTRENLWSLFHSFRFPEKFVSKGRNVFTGEEVFLFGLYRLSHPGKYDRLDVKNLFGFNDAGTASKCFHCFFEVYGNLLGLPVDEHC